MIRSYSLMLIPYASMILGLYIFNSAWLAFAIYHGLILIVLLKNKHLFSQLVKGWNLKAVLGSTLFGLLGGVILYVLAPLANISKETLQPTLAQLGLIGAPWILFVLYHSLVNPWFEEALWRGRLSSKSNKLITQDVVFALYHVLVLVLFLQWYWILLSVLMLTSASWLWRQLARQYKGLLTPVISHAAADASIMIVVFYVVL